MSPKNKHLAQPRLQSIGKSIFERWNRDKLIQIRNLVQRALELVDGSGDAPNAVAAIRAALDRIEEELAK